MEVYEELVDLFAAAIGIFIVLLIVFIAIMVVILIGHWKMYKKAGKEGWEAIIPIYSDYILVQIAGLNWWWFLIPIGASIIGGMDIPVISGLMSIVSLVANANIAYNISKKFNKSTAWFVVSIFFGGFTYAFLGYSSTDKYESNAATTKNGFVDQLLNNIQANTTNTNNANNTTNATDASNTTNTEKK